MRAVSVPSLTVWCVAYRLSDHGDVLAVAFGRKVVVWKATYQ